MDAERVMFASMAPIFDPEYELLRVRYAPMADEARRLLEGEAAARVFEIE